MRVCDYHKQDNKSVLDLPTPLELFKEEHTAEEYDELISFYTNQLNISSTDFLHRGYISLQAHKRLVNRGLHLISVTALQQEVMY